MAQPTWLCRSSLLPQRPTFRGGPLPPTVGAGTSFAAASLFLGFFSDEPRRTNNEKLPFNSTSDPWVGWPQIFQFLRRTRSARLRKVRFERARLGRCTASPAQRSRSPLRAFAESPPAASRLAGVPKTQKRIRPAICSALP